MTKDGLPVNILLHRDTPESVERYVVASLNDWQSGSGYNPQQLLAQAERMQASWTAVMTKNLWNHKYPCSAA